MKQSVSFATAGLTLLSLISVFPAQGQQSPSNLTELVKSTVDAVVLIVVSDENGRPKAEASGFIISKDGWIVTNHHVIAGARSAIVKLNNGAFFPVEGIVADDPNHDLSVIKVPGAAYAGFPCAGFDFRQAFISRTIQRT